MLPVDARSGLDDVINNFNQSGQVIVSLAFGKIVIQPIPGHDGVDSGGGIPVHTFTLPVTFLVESQAGIEAFFGKFEIANVPRDEVNKSGLGSLGSEFSGFRFDLVGQFCHEFIDTFFGLLIPFAFSAKCPLVYGREGVSVKKEPWVVLTDFSGPVRQLLSMCRQENR